MIARSFVDRLNQSMSFLYQRQWAEWEILTIAMTALFVLVWITRRQRKRAVRNIYENQFLEGSPVIGVNLGVHRRSHHVIDDLKKGRLAAVQKRHPMQQKSTKQTEPSEKLHEQIKQLQYEIIKRKQTEVRFEERLAHLTAANEKLQHVVHDTKQVEQQVTQEPATGEKQQLEIPESEQAGQDFEEQTAGVPAAEKPGEGKFAGKGKAYEDTHRLVDGVKQKLCLKCKEWKPESEFHKNASCKDGLAVSCKTCKAEAAREYRKRRKTAKG